MDMFSLTSENKKGIFVRVECNYRKGIALRLASSPWPGCCIEIFIVYACSVIHLEILTIQLLGSTLVPIGTSLLKRPDTVETSPFARAS